MMLMLDSLPVVTLAFLVSAAAVADLHSYKIPNWLTALTALTFLPVAVWSGMDIQAIGLHYLTGAALLLFGFLLYSYRIFGGGDAKFVAACGVWFGAIDSLQFLYAAVMCGGVLAIAMLFWTVFKYAVQLDFGDFIPGLRKAMPKIPYGIALAAGAILAIQETTWLTSVQQVS
jgi:prepilin peptidase CpaA